MRVFPDSPHAKKSGSRRSYYQRRFPDIQYCHHAQDLLASVQGAGYRSRRQTGYSDFRSQKMADWDRSRRSNWQKDLIYQDWRGGRAVEGTGLENRQRLTSLVGSNPTPSAISEQTMTISKGVGLLVPASTLGSMGWRRSGLPPPRGHSACLSEQRERQIQLYTVVHHLRRDAAALTAFETD
jgi:hypothetical protein